MADKPFLDLNDRGRLAYDQNPWIIQRRRNLDHRRGEYNWEGVSFVAHQKSTLMELLLEKGVQVEDEAARRLEAMLDTFEEWLARHDPDRFRANPALAGLRGLLEDGGG